MSALPGIYFHVSALLSLTLHVIFSTIAKLYICGFPGSIGASIWTWDAVTLKEIPTFVLKIILTDKADL